MSSPPTASLLGLPTELRLNIFSHVFHEREIQLYHPNGSNKIQPILSLLSVNHQIRSEALPLFYSSLHFIFRDGFTENDLRSWLTIVPANLLAKITSFVFYCKGQCTMYGLQPDTDYCQRRIMLRRLPSSPTKFSLSWDVERDLCSNEAYGCTDQIREALASALGSSSPSYMFPEISRESGLTTDDILPVFRVANRDNSSSTA